MENKIDFPWRKDDKLLEEAKSMVENESYENEVIFRFGLLLGLSLHEVDAVSFNFSDFNLHLHYRAPNVSPDAILFRDDTGEVMNIEFEKIDRNFEDHKHDASKCDMIICWEKDEEWKNPIPVLELKTRKVYKPQKQIEK